MMNDLPPRPAGTPAWRGIVYPLLISAVAVGVLVAVLGFGLGVPDPGGAGGAGGGPPSGGTHVSETVLRVVAALAAVAAVATAGGWLARKLGQPPVIGEIATGLLLGPSFLAGLLPGSVELFFPTAAKPLLGLLAQVGLILFMFAVGSEFDASQLRRSGRIVGAVSQGSMIIPFVLGVLSAALVYREFAAGGIGFVPFALFLGTAMSITAFPVLARIVQESGLARHPLGTMAMTCAAACDVIAWGALATAMAVASAGSIWGAGGTVLLAAGFAAVVLIAGRPLVRAADQWADRARVSSAARLLALLLLAFSLAWLTDLIGVHSIFGAFLAGTLVPHRKGSALTAVQTRLDSVNRRLLLPLFFVSVGMTVDLTQVTGHAGLLLAGAVAVVTAVVGKLAGTTVTARAAGLPWRLSLGLGVLLNARGVTEIVVLRAGLDAGLINQNAFTVLVVMAVLTTVMTGPALHLLKLSRRPGARSVHEGTAPASPAPADTASATPAKEMEPA
ncbi:cation:proton antiporter [Streptomyces sp. NBC_01619]|uniref:Cation:proton antiporter n=1 Tax=Streptomyces pratisoli TaxID=3139917 RepID=A0ACC6QK52_9ACTN|nr:cation:proton antiporter [Streptomyces sp. NBC_01619]MCX4512206.1 cation:proton antiporter [Streptomyces sp. NBC_01619]